MIFFSLALSSSTSLFFFPFFSFLVVEGKRTQDARVAMQESERSMDDPGISTTLGYQAGFIISAFIWD